MNWSGKRVLVTGAGGFIGSHLTEKLVSLGAETRAMVHYRSDGSLGWLDHSDSKDMIESYAGDISDRDSVMKAMNNREIVFHLAALIAIPYSYQAPQSYLKTNTEGTLNVLQAVRDTDAERMIHTSTSEVYGSAQYVPMDEGHPLKGQSPYAASKIGADKMAEAFNLSFGVPVTTIRPFNTYGPRQSSRAVIPTIITQALTGQPILLGNLEARRDFNFVADNVEAYIRCAEEPGAVGQVINIGSGREISIGELAATTLSLIGGDSSIVIDEQRLRPEASEVDHLCADNNRARAILGWAPSHTLEEGLEETIQWIRENLDKFRPGTYAI
jgi:NAD dependent epimerase/dehydratase